jgi:hypothetical protein
VALLEFETDGNTIWIHSPTGATVLRIKTMGKIIVSNTCKNSVSHTDVITSHDIIVCLADDAY